MILPRFALRITLALPDSIRLTLLRLPFVTVRVTSPLLVLICPEPTSRLPVNSVITSDSPLPLISAEMESTSVITEEAF